MKKLSRRSIPGILSTMAIVLLFTYVPSVDAQDYLFSVPRVVMDVRVQPDGSADLEYVMDFVNAAGAHPIDIVDVGLPHEKYSISGMRAWINGIEVSTIQPSQYVHPGVEVHLDSGTIPADGSGAFEFHTSISDLVFQDTTRKDYASMQITPTWFGSQYVQGTTDLTIRIHLPEGVKEEEALYQDVQFTGKETEDNHVVVSWQVNRAFTGPYRVGVSFPKRVMTRVVTMTFTELLMRWYKGTFSNDTRIWIGIGSAVALGVVFFRFTAGTGCIFYVMLLGVLGFFYISQEATQVYVWPVLILLGVVVEVARRKKKRKYLPAIASVEGGGIKRGLTAPEAAVLLELPVRKVVAMILFGMMKKGLIRQTQKDPVAFEVIDPQPEGLVVHAYEKRFRSELRKANRKPVKDLDFSKEVRRQVEAVVRKMKGFDVEETRKYYQHIITRAWAEAKAGVGDIDAWQKKMDERIDWMFLDPDFDDRFRPYQGRYIPRSYRTFPSSSSAGSSVPSVGSPPSGAGAPRFSDVAASVSGWFQNTAQGVVAKVEGEQSGIVNFASVDKAVSKAMASSGSGRSGGGGCACACAGCACACACAGGGR